MDPARMRRVYYGIDASPFEAAGAARDEHRADLRREFGFGAQDPVFVCVARFAPQKAHDVLLEAFARARDAVGGEARPRLLLVGGLHAGLLTSHRWAFWGSLFDGNEKQQQEARRWRKR